MSEEDVNFEMVLFYACLSVSLLYSTQGDTWNMLMWLLFALFFMAWDVSKGDKSRPKVPQEYDEKQLS